MKTILFYWSRGAEVRRKIMQIIGQSELEGKPCYLSSIAEQLGVSHVAAKKHVDLLVEEKYVTVLNPHGKPLFLGLTPEGKKVYEEFYKKPKK